MAKIVAITQDMISIGMDDGTLREVAMASLNFVPHIGDEVELFEAGERIIVSKMEKQPVAAAVPQQPVQQMPNIVIHNTSSNVNTNVNKNNNHAGTGNPKNKWVALALCFFLGYLGAHKFYEGKAGMGILYLLTGGLFLVGVVVDFIAILAKPNPYYV